MKIPILHDIIKRIWGKKNKNIEDNVDAEEIMINRNKIPFLLKDMEKNPELIINAFQDFYTVPLYYTNQDLSNSETIECYTIHNFFRDYLLKRIFASLEPVAFVAPTTNIHTIHTMLFDEKKPLLAVVDGFGSIQGFINKEVFLEFIYKDYRPITVTRTIKGDVHFEDIKHFIKIPTFEKLQSFTVGGLIMEYLGRIPKKNEEFILDNYKIKILESNDKYISEVYVEKIKEDNAE